MSRFRRNLMEYTMKQNKLSSIPSVGDYLKNDLKTVVRASSVTGADASIVGVCIGQNPVNNKYIFVYTQFTNDYYNWEKSGSGNQYLAMYSAASKYTLSSNSAGQSGKIPNATIDSNTAKYDFGGLENTKTWYSLMNSKNYTVNNSDFQLWYKLLLLNGYSSLNEFIADKDNFDGWYVMGGGELNLLYAINSNNANGATYNMFCKPNAQGFSDYYVFYWSSIPFNSSEIWRGYVSFDGSRYFGYGNVLGSSHGVFALQRAAS